MDQVLRVHATAVALEGRGVLITGQAGRGKSSLALQFMAWGATLVSDDQTELWVQKGALWARAPATIEGLIEARGIGILTAVAAPSEIVFCVTLDAPETDRIPNARQKEYLGVTVPLLHKVDSPAWPAGILQYLRGTRKEP
ncbi:HPr kinase/phosphatase C-terminal domain-containing protein [uncultured Tateyamaria sp.]|uniref:HPr kinase/phosphorylase n=1 Tax=uncultured Tateyamaria sp. TaxID=455651 RepID=UPI00261528A0|nr:HPr kinase/phosphatase C-terminal domain-containing protein [uncultured Tateyamaria sp.]